jgi:hypothetical protein
MNTAHDVHGAALIFRRPLRVMLADDLGRIAQNVGGILDAAAGHQDLSCEGMPEPVGMRIAHSACAEYSLQGSDHRFDVPVASTRTGPAEVLAICSRALGQWQAVERNFHFRLQRQPDHCSVLDRVQKQVIVPHTVLAQGGHVRNAQSVEPH